MAWNLKQKAQDHIVSIGLGLIVLLLLAVWRAVPSSAWDKVSEATPKRALWALLGLAGIAICFLVGALIDNRRKQKRALGLSDSNPQYLESFGLLWDKWLNPLCPIDQSVLKHAAAYPDMHGHSDLLICRICERRFWIDGERDGALSLVIAQQKIRNARTMSD